MIFEKLLRRKGNDMKKEEVNKLKQKIHEANEAYMKGNPIMDDPTYDTLVEQLVDIEGDSARPYSRTKQTDNINDVTGTIGNKLYGITTPFVNDKKYYVRDFIHKHQLTSETLVAIQYKLDGCSIAFDYETERFFTRGDYANGESSDVTPLFERALPQMYELNKRYDNELRSAKFEFICPREVYNAYFNKEYKRPRDVAAAHLKVVSDADKMETNIKVCNELCDLIPLRVITKSNRTYVVEDVVGDIIPATDYTRIESFIDILGKNEFCMSKRPHNTTGFNDTTIFNYECDGVVVTTVANKDDAYVSFYDDFSTETASIQDAGLECAIKILQLLKETKIKSIKFSYGKTGRITPVAILEPISFDGVTVDHVTLSNLSRIHEDHLCINDTVEIMYNIIPYFVRSFHDGDEPIELPTTCPLCGYPLDISEGYKTAYCVNKSCVGKNLGSIVRYAESIGIFGLKDSTISKLMEAHLVSTIPDLYRLTAADISSLDTFGDKSAQNIIDNINASKQHLTFPRFLSGFQFRYISQKTWIQICEEINLTPSLLMDSSTLQLAELIAKSKIRNVGAATKRFLIEGFIDNLDIIKETMQYIPSFEPFKTISDYKGIITMTGTHDKAFIKDVTDAGYVVRDWSNQTDILVIPDESYTSNKVTNALKRAIPIYTLQQARNKLL